MERCLECVFYILIFNSALHHNVKTEKGLLKHEKEKKQEYDRWIMKIENGTFTSLVFSVSGVLGKECSMIHKHGWKNS